MYDRLRGELVELTPVSAVVDVAGVGYELAIPQSTFASLRGSRSALLFTHLHVREDELRLYGFASQEERRIFRLVLGVNGVGPAIALACLSISPREIVAALAAGEVKTLQRVKGVGRRVAERMVVDLKDRAAAMTAAWDGDRPSTSTSVRVIEPSRDGVSLGAAKRQEAERVLVELGFARGAAEERVEEALVELTDPTLEDVIKWCVRP